MRAGILLALIILSGCAAVPLQTTDRLPRARALSASPGLATHTLEANDRGYPDDVVTLIDSRTIRALRKHRKDIACLDLTHGQKVGMWVGVGVVAAYLVANWIEDNVVLFPSE
jgi:hypothetical protein